MNQKTVIVYDTGTLIDPVAAAAINAVALTMRVQEVSQTPRDVTATATLAQIADAPHLGLKFKTSMTPVGELYELFEKLSEQYDQILFFPVMKVLSGQYAQAKTLEREFNKLRVYNTDDSMVSQGELLKEVRRLLDAGATPDDIEAHVQERKNRFCCFVGFDRIDGLIASGRGSKTLGSIAKFLRLRLVISMKDAIDKVAIAKSLEACVDKLLKAVHGYFKDLQHTDIENLIVYNGECEPRLIDLVTQKVKEKFKRANVIVSLIPPVMLVHSLKNSFAIFLEIKKGANLAIAKAKFMPDTRNL